MSQLFLSISAMETHACLLPPPPLGSSAVKIRRGDSRSSTRGAVTNPLILTDGHTWPGALEMMPSVSRRSSSRLPS